MLILVNKLTSKRCVTRGPWYWYGEDNGYNHLDIDTEMFREEDKHCRPITMDTKQQERVEKEGDYITLVLLQTLHMLLLQSGQDPPVNISRTESQYKPS